MREDEKKFIESKLRNIPRDAGAKHYRASWFAARNFECPKRHDIKHVWERCYLPMAGYWPGADCLDCAQARRELKENQKANKEFSCCRSKAGKESRRPCLLEKGCLRLKERLSKSAAKTKAKKRERHSSLPILEISLCDGENLGTALERLSARERESGNTPKGRSSLPRRILLAIGIQFLRRSFEIVARFRANHCS